jgi:hypothetical protein
MGILFIDAITYNREVVSICIDLASLLSYVR